MTVSSQCAIVAAHPTAAPADAVAHAVGPGRRGPAVRVGAVAAVVVVLLGGQVAGEVAVGLAVMQMAEQRIMYYGLPSYACCMYLI